MNGKDHFFGGSWTQEKLERLGKYLHAYTTIMRNKPYNFAYIDAFAGTGYCNLKMEDNSTELMFPELVDSENQQFLEGSVKIALEVKPRFNKFIFIDNDKKHIKSLENLIDTYPELKKDTKLVPEDANSYLQDLCLKRDWNKHRAVLFLDPYGMEVEWKTIEAIAKTKAIDLWILFPLGIGINRLLRRDGKIHESIRFRLDKVLGTHEWIDIFYKKEEHELLYGKEVMIKKIVNFDGISKYFVDRLKTIFAGVANNPLPLYNSTNNPLYLLCFASSNKAGAPTALKIAEYILKH